MTVRGGHGGRGSASLRSEPFTPRGGPDGGDGGRGGSVVLVADRSLSTLGAYGRKTHWQAPDGEPGRGGFKDGRQGGDLLLKVPVGTQVLDEVRGKVLGDLDRDGARLPVASGGAGGRGNVHFKGPANRTPRFAEPGLSGEERSLRLELKLIADAGLVGPPNAGKSSLLRAISAARPKVADYPFTTLEPVLGVVQGESLRFVVADIPGLIEGASTGAGLGQRFLRHLERTRLLVEVADAASTDPWADLRVLRTELTSYAAALADRPALTVLNKIDLPAAQELRARTAAAEVYWVSALTGEGVPELVKAIEKRLASLAQAPPPAPEPALQLRRRRSRRPPVVERRAWGFELAGEALTRLVERTDFDSPESLQRFQVQLDRIGASAALADAGAEPGDTVRIGELEFEYQP